MAKGVGRAGNPPSSSSWQEMGMKNMQVNLHDQVAIVTGGSAGIGAAIVKAFIAAGAKVIIVDREQEKGKKLVRESGENAAFLAKDLYKISELPEIVEFAHQTFGRIDCLVNCAGMYPSQPALMITENDWDRVIDLNLKVPFFLSQTVVQYMIQYGIKGSIVNISSTAALMARPGVVHYCASKAGLAMQIRVLALEWAQYGIRVNAVSPGLVETDTLLASLTTPELQKEHQEKIAKAPLQRAAEPAEIAMGVLYFADNQSAGFITGQSLYIDGGYTAGQTFASFNK